MLYEKYNSCFIENQISEIIISLLEIDILLLFLFKYYRFYTPVIIAGVNIIENLCTFCWKLNKPPQAYMTITSTLWTKQA